MPTVTGALQDFGLESLNAYKPEIIFTPSGAASARNSLFASRPIKVIPASNGSFTVTLANTTILRPEVWYNISIRWLDPLAGYQAADFPQWRVRVPGAGGLLGDLIEAQPSSQETWIGDYPPNNPAPYLWWIDTSVLPPVLNEWN
jgi:hypothetical protein